MIFLVLSGKMIFLFSENMMLFFRHKTKDDLSQKKYLEILYFLYIFWKDDLSKKIAPEHDLFCNIWKDGISFFQKIWFFFFRRKMKEDGLYQKTRGNMIFSVYMHRGCRREVPFWQQKPNIPRKNTPKGDISGITEKEDIHPRFILLLLKYHIHWHPKRGQRSSHRRCSARKGVLRNFEKFTGKDL